MRLAGIALDAFGTLFDLSALRGPLERTLGERAERAFDAFTARLVPWTWHATASGHYRPLPQIAALALEAAAAEAEGELSREEATGLAGELASLPAYPGVVEGLEQLAADGHRLAVLSNGTRTGVEALVSGAGLNERFQHLLPADEVGRFKPAPDVYALAVEAFDARPKEVLLVSAHAWDVAGARQSGLRGAWLHRQRPLVTAFDEQPDVMAADVVDLARALREHGATP